MEIAEVDSLSEFRQALTVTADAWNRAFSTIVSDEAFRIVEALAEEGVEERFSSIREVNRGITLVAKDAGEVIGSTFVVWDPDWTESYIEEQEAQIRTLYVHPNRWGEGIGSRLLHVGIELLPEEINRVKLETFKENDLARSFYLAKGFEEVGETSFEIAGRSYPSVVYARDVVAADRGRRR